MSINIENQPLNTSHHIAVVIPAYRVENYIERVVSAVPSFVRTVIVIDDFSPDNTGKLLDHLSTKDKKLVVIHHDANLGVGGATTSGYREALKQGAEIIVKLDGDGQMNPSYIEKLVSPIINGEAEFAKGNRFHNWTYLESMPLLRKIGNLGLSLLIKIASGYWNVFDPTNGFTAISAKTLSKIDFEKLEQGHLFESSMLVSLYAHNARIAQIPMRAVYNDAPSSLSIKRSLFSFPVYLIGATARRFIDRYVWQDFTAVSVFVLFGILGIAFGSIFGGYHWIKSIQTSEPATAGTVMLSAISIILGFQLLLQAIVLDIQNTPK